MFAQLALDKLTVYREAEYCFSHMSVVKRGVVHPKQQVTDGK
jgi:hypothetical protein